MVEVFRRENPDYILSYFFLFFLIIGLYFLITAVIEQIFKPTAKLAVPRGKPTNEAKAEIERHPLTVETKLSNQIIMFFFF